MTCPQRRSRRRCHRDRVQRYVRGSVFGATHNCLWFEMNLCQVVVLYCSSPFSARQGWEVRIIIIVTHMNVFNATSPVCKTHGQQYAEASFERAEGNAEQHAAVAAWVDDWRKIITERRIVLQTLTELHAAADTVPLSYICGDAGVPLKLDSAAAAFLGFSEMPAVLRSEFGDNLAVIINCNKFFCFFARRAAAPLIGSWQKKPRDRITRIVNLLIDLMETRNISQIEL